MSASGDIRLVEDSPVLGPEDHQDDHQASEDSSARQMSASVSAEVDATQIYLREIGFSMLLTAEEEVFYGRLSQQGDMNARNKMIECNLRLVVRLR